MGKPTENDYKAFKKESRENKIAVLYNYICQNGGNMQEIARNVLHDYNEQASQRVSVITRCYGFEGNNQGRFKNIGATEEDVAAFVDKYPNGIPNDKNGLEMQKFLRERVEIRNQKQRNNAIINKKSYENNAYQNKENSANKYKNLPIEKQELYESDIYSYDRESKTSLGDWITFIIIMIVGLIIAGLLIVFLFKLFKIFLKFLVIAVIIMAFIGIMCWLIESLLNGRLLLVIFKLGFASIFFWIGIEGFKNGGSIFITLMFCAVGLSIFVLK